MALPAAAARPPLTWVVGAGGLLGRHVVATAPGPLVTAKIPWGEPERARQQLAATASALTAGAAEQQRPWQVLWCAGAGVTSTGDDALANELAALSAALDGLGQAGDGAVFLASSVGGIYAGNANPPFTEFSEPSPLAPYGWAKLRGEQLVQQWSQATGNPALIGRITNLFGPGQNLAKPQGLISQVLANHVRRRPSSIWVSMDTIRDYLYVADAAALVHAGMAALDRSAGPTIKILASGMPLSISAVMGEIKRVIGRRPECLIGASPSARFQARNLVVRSVVLPELDHLPRTPFPAGIAATLADLRLAWERPRR